MIIHWLLFFVSVAVIVYAGSKLTRNAAVIAENTGIGTAWVGVMMLPLATSLPELVTTIRAVLIDAPDLALGNVLGSCLFNLALLAVIDLLEGRGALTARVNQGHIITASLSIITISLASIAMLGVAVFPLGWVGLETLLIALIYLFGSRLIYRHEKRKPPLLPAENTVEKRQGRQPTSRAVMKFLAAAGFVVAAGVLLTDASDQIAIETGLGHSFVGSLFLAVSTSLPETVTTITAVRLGYLDMAVANIFGANFMNLFIVFIADIFYRQAPLLHIAAQANLFSAVMIILLSTVIIFGLVYRPRKAIAWIGPDAVLVLAGYLTAIYIIFKLGGN